ncbi:sucrose-6-phosphate hydrolase [Ectobacillus sp. JY-23]|uniref:glycoside hydrolase family 32 protein n=1 Tax=Ectobacillus sp. JY-23 TaxID=2933872 RepID=UPI001FF1E55E|nr:sucrose-6-phosphate hydrolase [Ectobacillus sp. JY-23]UOY91737.1 sucrose-6-phosphate hydrolase [Ectobacillus sp. JY-23]
MNRYREPKYRTIVEAGEGELEALRDKSLHSIWKPRFHIHPQFGLMNDPNGLAFYKGEYHVFYQWYPFEAMHGMKHWAHVKSKDLVNWERMPVALVPLEDYESHGAYSGASIEVEGKLYLYYTGNLKYGPIERSANQCLAIMDESGHIKKYEQNPVIAGTPKGYTGHVRDPKVFRKDDTYYMLLGAQREDLTGAIVVYESIDALQWTFKGELDVAIDLQGYMWECPDYFELDGKDVFIFSPQGIAPAGHSYHNVYNVVVAVGSLDMKQMRFEVEFYQELDKGFDFYAPQTFEDENGKRMLFAWAGSGEVAYPTDSESWAHCLSIPRELSIENGKLLQRPAKQMELLRRQHMSGQGKVQGYEAVVNEDTSYEFELHFEPSDATKFGVELFASAEERLVVTFDKDAQVVTVNREQFEHAFGGEYGFVRSEAVNLSGGVKVHIFVDRSIAEIFINDGEIVFTTRVFPKEDAKGINVFSNGTTAYTFTKHTMKDGISI